MTLPLVSLLTLWDSQPEPSRRFSIAWRKLDLVRRERDPNDGRRVIVKLAKGADGGQEMEPLFASLGTSLGGIGGPI